MQRLFIRFLLCGFLCGVGSLAQAQVFEVIEPDVERGEVEIEFLTGVVMSEVEEGGNRAAHEFALSIAPLSFWKTTAAFEIAHVRGEGTVYEAVEWENLFLLPFGAAEGDDELVSPHDDDGASDSFITFQALALYTAIEIPSEGGLDTAEFAVGPVLGLSIWEINTITNLFAEIPFEDDEDAGFSYAFAASYEFYQTERTELAAGFEAHGTVDGAFVDAVPLSEQGHFIGPALYSEMDLGGLVLEPRLAFLFGLTDASDDAVASINFEVKF